MKRSISIFTILMLLCTQFSFASSSENVKNLTAESNVNSITLSWQNIDGVNYRISRLKNNKYVRLATTPNGSYVHDGLIAGKKYRYKVSAIKDGKIKDVKKITSIPKFATPVITSNDEGFGWNEIPSAKFYKVYKDSEEVCETCDNSYPTLDVEGTYKVKAGRKFYCYTKYWNKKTKSWTTKKPLSKNRGNCTRRSDKHYGMRSYNVYRYFYSDFSNEIIVSSGDNSGNNPDNPSGGDNGNNSDKPSGGNTGGDSTGGNTPDTPTTDSLYVTNSSTHNSINLNWNDVDGAAYYDVLGPNGTTTTSETSYSDSDLKPDTQYKYTVKAINEDGSVKVSKSAVVKTKSIPTIKGLNSSAEYKSIVWSWDSIKGVDGYSVIVKDANGKEVLNTKTSDATISVNKLTPNKKYVISVCAYIGSKKGGLATNECKTLNTDAMNISTSSTYRSVTVSWPESDAATYEVTCEKGTVSRNHSSAKIDNLAPETAVNVTVRRSLNGVNTTKNITCKTTSIPEAKVRKISDWSKVGIEFDDSEMLYEYKLYVTRLGFRKELYREDGYLNKQFVVNMAGKAENKLYQEALNRKSADLNVDTNEFTWELTPRYEVDGTVYHGPTTTVSVYPKQLDFDVFQIDKTCTLDYGNTTIYLGQKWSDEIDNALNAGSSGRAHYVKKNGIGSSDYNYPQNGHVENDNVYDKHIYMYDVGDYDHFLEVEVEAGQITSWLTTQDNMGSQNGVTLRRGDKTTSRNGTIDYTKPEWAETRFTDIDTGGAIMGGFATNSEFFINAEHTKTRFASIDSDLYYSSMNIEDEKEIGRHYINAARIAGRIGLKPLIRDSDAKKYFEYGGPVTIYDRTIKKNTTTCYGAQAWADTLKENNAGHDGVEFDHDVLYPKGPCANATLTARVGYAVLYASKGHFDGTGEIMAQCGGSGTGCFFPYLESAGHEPMFFNRDATHIGLGIIPGHYTVVQVGYKNKTPDKWYTLFAPQ